MGVGHWANNPSHKKESVTKRQENASDENGIKKYKKRLMNKDLRFGTWNIRTLATPGALNILSEELDRYQMDLVALQEVRYPGTGKLETDKHILYYSGSENGKFQKGVAFMVNKRLAAAVIEFQPIDDRIAVLRLKGRFTNITIITLYAPTEEAEDEEKDTFYEILEEVINNTPGYDMKLIVGDANAKVGREIIWKGIAGNESLHLQSNDNGVRLLSCASSANLRVMSTYFPRKDIHKATWVSPDGRTKNQIDHVLVDQRHKSSIMNVKTIRGAEAGTDHYLVVAEVRQRIATEKPRGGNSIKDPKIDIDRLKDNAKAQEFVIKLQNKFDVLTIEDNLDIEAHWEMVKTSVQEAALEVCGKRKRKKNPWFSEECEQKVKERRAAKGKHLQQDSNESKEAYENANRETKTLLRRKKREYVDSLIKKAEEDKSAENARDFYRSVRFFRKGYIPRMYGIKDKSGNAVLERSKGLEIWKEYFEELLNVEDGRAEKEQQNEYQSADPLVEPPTIKEIIDAIKILKNNKAPGRDGISAELFKKGGIKMAKEIHQLVTNIWNEERMPEEWTEAIIIPIHKKGDKQQCRNYRGISLISTAYKVFSKILQKKLEPYLKEVINEKQAGFIKNRSTTDQIFILKEAISKYWEYNKTMAILFVDFRKAYDSIFRDKLWEKMQRFGIPKKIINLVKVTLKSSKGVVKMDGEYSKAFNIKTGVRQGDGISPLLFNIVIQEALDAASEAGEGIKIGTKINVLAFADDVALIAENLDDLKILAKKLFQKAKEVGLEVNDEKTKFMRVERNGRTKKQATLQIDDHMFEEVEEFKYLGVVINNKNEEKQEIEARVKAASRASYSLNKLLSSKIFSRRTKLRMYKTIIRPVLLYGAEIWRIDKHTERKMKVFENKILRKIFGPICEGGEWRRRKNRELRELYNEPDVVAEAKTRRLRWAGHVYRREQGSLLKEVWENKPEGRRPPGRPKMRWRDQVAKDLLVMGAKEEDAEDRIQWRRLLDEAKNRLRFVEPGE